MAKKLTYTRYIWFIDRAKRGKPPQHHQPDGEVRDQRPEHWEQVERNVIELAKNTPGCDIEVARLFAILHDCKRQDEGVDKEHGRRAAEFARELYYKGLLEIDPEQFSSLNFAIKYHNDGLVSGDPTIGACWDADRLDLPRVGIAPVADMLSTQYAKERL